MFMLPQKAKAKPLSNRGQIVVEYILLLSIAVTLAMIIITTLVKRGDPDDPQSSGALIQKWREVQDSVAKDVQN
jgi:uncharacterized protein (UPF0333 family)